METLEPKFNTELQNDFLKGAKVVWYKKGQYTISILIRLPKGSFEVSTSSFYNSEVHYEYKFYQNLGDDGKMYCAVLRNGHIREVKRNSNKDHWDDEAYGRRMAEKKKTTQ